MRKVILIILVVILLLPVLPSLIPEEVTIDTIVNTFEDKFLTVENVRKVDPPQLDSAKQWRFTINGYSAELYYYEDYAALVKQFEYQKKDAGTAIVETWNLRESLGAAPNPNIPTFAGRNDPYMLVVRTPDKEIGQHIIKVFKDI